MKKNPNSSINAQRRVMDGLKKKVCEWLYWDEMTYAQFQYDMGLAYLRFYIPGDRWGQDMLERSRVFWSWWRLQWAGRDAEFTDVENGKPETSVDNLRRHYKHHNDAANLASDIHPGSAVLDETYNQMIAELHKSKVHA